MNTIKRTSVSFAVLILLGAVLSLVSNIAPLPLTIGTVAEFVLEYRRAISLLCVFQIALAIIPKGAGFLSGILSVVSLVLLNVHEDDPVWISLVRWFFEWAGKDNGSYLFLLVYFFALFCCILMVFRRRRFSSNHTEKPESLRTSTAHSAALASMVMTFLVVAIVLVSRRDVFEPFQNISLNIISGSGLPSAVLFPPILFFTFYLVFRIISGLIDSKKAPPWMLLIEEEAPKLGRGMVAISINMLKGFLNLASHMPDVINDLLGLLMDRGSFFPATPLNDTDYSPSDMDDTEKSEDKYTERALMNSVLAFSVISFLTTAAGMKGYVFGDGREWLAYLASFAVQGVLIAGGLGFSRLFDRIHEKNFGVGRKRTLFFALILLLSSTMITSSIFSYTFIAEVAYRGNGSCDAEAKISSVLLEESTKLEKKAEKMELAYSGQLLTLLTDKIRPIVVRIRQRDLANESNSGAAFRAFTLKNLSSHDLMEALKKRHPNHEAIIASLETTYETLFYSALQEIVSRCNVIILDMNQGAVVRADVVCEELTNICDQLELLASSVEGLETYIAKDDLRPLKTAYLYEVNRLQTYLSTLKEHINPAAEDPLKSVELLEKDAYLWSVEQVSDEDVMVATDEAQKLVKVLSANDVLQSGELKEIAQLSSLLNNYGKARQLAEALKEFRQKRASKVYSLSGPEAVDQQTWKDQRNQDITSLLELLGQFPDSANIGEESDFIDEELYERLSRMRRNYLGEYTSFERSVGYLHSDYPFMAYVSVFIALIFDSSCILVGYYLNVMHKKERVSVENA